jgi:diaminopimelate decarboxylase
VTNHDLLDDMEEQPIRPVAGLTRPIAVAGPLCDAGDVFTQHDGGFVEFRELPLPEAGDIAILRGAGSYGATMSSN